jgi:short-subunit dehydrogenase
MAPAARRMIPRMGTFPGTPGTALVTGASSGIGLAIARELASRGWALVLTARRLDRLEAAAAELRAKWGGRVAVLAADLSTPAGARTLCTDLARAGITVDLLVNNAGLGHRALFAEADPDVLMRIVRVNTVALTELTRALLPAMIERRRGGVINVASTAAFAPGPHMAVYYASKAYVESLSVALGHELRGTGVVCTCLCPGPVPTEFEKVAGTENTSLFKRLTSVRPEVVARRAVDGFERSRAIVMPGLMNRVVTLATRLLSRRRAAAVVGGIQAPKA